MSHYLAVLSNGLGSVKGFIVLCSDFKNKEQDKMIKIRDKEDRSLNEPKEDQCPQSSPRRPTADRLGSRLKDQELRW